MRLTRRKTLLGLGTLATSVGLIGASGAFDTVEADRDFDVEVSGDSEALLEFSNEDGDYVETEVGMIQISIGGKGENDEGLNDNAVTKFTELFDIVNNGTESVGVWLDTNNIAGVSFSNNDDDSGLNAEADAVTVTNSDPITVDLEVDTNYYTEPEQGEYNITVHADTEDAGDSSSSE